MEFNEIFNDNYSLYNMDRMEMEDLMTYHEPQIFPEVEESSDLLCPAPPLPFDDLLVPMEVPQVFQHFEERRTQSDTTGNYIATSTRTVEEFILPFPVTFNNDSVLVPTSESVVEEKKVYVGLEAPSDTNWNFQGINKGTVETLNLPFPVTFSNENCMEPMYQGTQDMGVIRTTNNGFYQELNFQFEAPMLNPTQNTEEIQSVPANRSTPAPATKKVRGKKSSTMVKPKTSKATKKGDADKLLDKEELLKLRPRLKKVTRNPVPKERKDQEYYEKRAISAMASRKCREKKRQIDEGRVTLIKETLDEIESLKMQIHQYKMMELGTKYMKLQQDYQYLLDVASKLLPNEQLPTEFLQGSRK